MNCVKCGAKLEENDMFCSNCGEPVQKTNEVQNNAIQNENVYTYERNINQQVNDNQYKPNVQNYVSSDNSQTKPKKKSKNTKDIMIISISTFVGLIILILIIFTLKLMISGITDKFKQKNKDDQATSTNTNSIITNNNFINDTNIDGNNNIYTNTNNGSGINDTTSTYKVNLQGFKFHIPDDLIYETASDELVIGDSLNTWIVELGIKQGSFQQLKQNKANIRTTLITELAQYGGTVSEPKLETINGVEYLLLECSNNSENAIIAYASLNSMNFVCIAYQNINNDFNRDGLEIVSQIISTSEYTGITSGLESSNDSKLSNILEATIKAGNEE